MCSRNAAYVRGVDDEAEAIRAIGQPGGEGPELPPLCPRCRRRDMFWTSDNQACPLCDHKGRSGSWLICPTCAEEAQVCVYDAAPLDGSSEQAVPWLAEVVAVARRAREEAQFGKPRPHGKGRYTTQDYKR